MDRTRIERAQLLGEKRLLQGALALPEPVQRRLAGAPVRIGEHELSTEAQLLLRINELAPAPAIESVPIPEGRALMSRSSWIVGGSQPVGSVREIVVGSRSARLYVPRELIAVGKPSPVLIFFHGGGFVYGDLDSHDASCRFLAERAGVRVLSVDYRLAPEHTFPGAYEDAMEAVRWTFHNAGWINADERYIAVGGDSAGGNLTVAVALQAAREGLPLKLQLAIYPATDPVAETWSRDKFGAGFFLTEEFMDIAVDAYTPEQEQRLDPRVRVLGADIPDGVAPAYLCTAGFDPLRDEGRAYKERLREAGVPVTYQEFGGQIHGFFNWVGVGRSARSCVADIADALRTGLRA